MTSASGPGPGSGSGSNDAPLRAASPSNSFYAMSDDEEGDYDTITHTQSGRGVKLMFSKSKVRTRDVPNIQPPHVARRTANRIYLGLCSP